MVRALLCATHDKTSDRESARRSRVDLDWRWAMGVNDDFSGIVATTFSLFRARLVLEEDDHHLLCEVQKTSVTEVETLLGDMAYSDPELREATEEAGVDLVAKVPPVTNAGRFPKTDFSIDTAAGTVTCPAGVTTADAKKEKDHKGRPGRRFVFPAATCAACPLRERCVKGARAERSIFVSRHEDPIAAARAAQEEPETKALLRRRSKVERQIDHLQDLGMRQARYRGRRKTTLQALLAATVANFKRLFVLGAFDTTATTVAA